MKKLNIPINPILTNADRIRSMTDEELAAALLRMLDGDMYCTNRPECGAMLDTDDGIPNDWCAQCLLNWLRKPTEEENWGVKRCLII